MVLLPVSIISFFAKKQTSEVKLIWKTASESNLSHYLVQRSTNGKLFENIAKIKANNVSGVFEYGYTDKIPGFGANYYKIVGVDFDGTLNETKVEVITFGISNTINIHPNPIVNNVNLSGLNIGDIIKISDLSGKIITTILYNGVYTATLNLETLTSGFYFLTVLNEGKIIYSQKIVKN
jgi:hypothetical protein